MTRQPTLVWCPFPDPDSARGCAELLLAEQLVACANIMPPMQSLFVWQGALGEASETGVLFKTTADLVAAAIARIGELHSYEEPAVLAWPCAWSHEATQAWLAALPPADARKGCHG